MSDEQNLQSPISNLQFEVSDTGPGIAPDELNTLFEPFVQTKTGEQSQEGTGLGLPISHRFVQLMGGDIQVESPPSILPGGGEVKGGQGTTFIFDIQVELADAVEIENRKSKIQNRVIALEPNQPCYRILIADDRWDNRQLLVKLLSPFAPVTALQQAQDDSSEQDASTALNTGFELREAENGQEAIEIWEEWQPHLIWMDIRMPVMDGYEATKQIKAKLETQSRVLSKAEELGPQTVIIALTASTFEEERAVILGAGCDDFLRKPFLEADIFDMMHKHLGVRFVYQEQAVPSETKEIDQSILTPAALATLPAELRVGLQEAVELLDIETANNIIDQIYQFNEPLAETLAELVKSYQFDRLQEVLAETEE